MSYFPRTSAQINISESRVAPMADYERIHAKIVRGVNRQIEGDKEVEDGLREMISSKAYLKHYKSIAAYAEHEFGKSKGWVYERIRIRLPITDVNKAPCAPADQVPNSTSKREEVSLKKVEAARVQSQGPDSEEVAPAPRVRTEAGKPKRDLSIWKEIEERLLGVAANRVDTLNHECPNPVFHKKLQDQLSACFATLAMWRESVK